MVKREVIIFYHNIALFKLYTVKFEPRFLLLGDSTSSGHRARRTFLNHVFSLQALSVKVNKK